MLNIVIKKADVDKWLKTYKERGFYFQYLVMMLLVSNLAKIFGVSAKMLNIRDAQRLALLGAVIWEELGKTLKELESVKDKVVFYYQELPDIMFNWDNLPCFDTMEEWNLFYRMVSFSEVRRLRIDKDEVTNFFENRGIVINFGVLPKYYDVYVIEDIKFNILRREFGFTEEYFPVIKDTLKKIEFIADNIYREQRKQIEDVYGNVKVDFKGVVNKFMDILNIKPMNINEAEMYYRMRVDYYF